MKNVSRPVHLVIVLLMLLLSACGPGENTTEKVSPSRVEPIEGTDLSRVILTEKAAERIGLETVKTSGKTVPYAAIIYDTEGNTWIYTRPQPLTFVRVPIVIDHIEDDTVILAQDLDSELTIVTVGVIEIYGTETGVSK